VTDILAIRGMEKWESAILRVHFAIPSPGPRITVYDALTMPLPGL